MCGIVGYIGTKPFNTDTLKILMLINGYERGMDSTGTYCKEAGIIKDTLDVHDYIVKYSIEPTNLFIGHTRSKTIGAVSKRTAHPFKYKNIVLVHNGTLQNHHLLFSKMNIKSTDWEVDSEAIAAKLAKDQNPMIFSEIKGAAAVIFTDVNKPDTMYVFRNKERPLNYVKLTNGLDKWMYISSTSESLEVAGFKTTDIKQFEEDTFYVISKGEIISSQVIESLPIEYTNSVVVSGTKKRDWTNKYVKCDRTEKGIHNGIPFEIKCDKYYYVVKDDNTTDILISYEDRKVLVSRYAFSWLEEYIKTLTIGEIGKFNTYLVLNKGTKEEVSCAEINDLAEVINIESTDEITVKNLRTGEQLLVKRRWIDFKFIKELVV